MYQCTLRKHLPAEVTPHDDNKNNNTKLKLRVSSAPVKMLHTDLRASKKLLLGCDFIRLKVAQEAALAGSALQSKFKHIATLQKESRCQDERVERHLRNKEKAKQKEKFLVTEAQQLFTQMRAKMIQNEKQQVHKEKVITQQNMIEFEERRVGVLWKVLAECKKHYFTPLECRELSRLFLHLKRATTE